MQFKMRIQEHAFTLRLQTDMNGRAIVQKVLWAYIPCIEAFKYCRPVISIDATHTYGKYSHKLLIATSMDGCNHIVPLAFVLVYEELLDSWAWFLYHLRIDIIGQRDEQICIISYRHSGILAAARYPEVGL